VVILISLSLLFELCTGSFFFYVSLSVLIKCLQSYILHEVGGMLSFSSPENRGRIFSRAQASWYLSIHTQGFHVAVISVISECLRL
jgi:hypothetical protein